MPILEAEINLYPADLLVAPHAAEGRWWAMYTLSQQEKKLMRRLLAREISFFCPIVPRHYRSSAGRRRVSHLPLFTNYVFVRGGDEARTAALATGCVSRQIPIHHPEEFLRQMRDIRLLIDSGRSLTVESLLEPGAPVRLRSGPMAGVRGFILKRRGERRFLVAVNFLQQGASIDVEDWEFERE